jgi:N-methylhydantoinase A
MTRLINIDNGGTLTDFCLVDGDEVRYTKTLTTPCDLSRCLFDGLGKVSELVYSEPRLAALLQSIHARLGGSPSHHVTNTAGRTRRTSAR